MSASIGENEKRRLEKFADDQELVNLVYGILAQKFDLNDIGNTGMEDIHLGQITRARIVGRQLLDDGFIEIMKHKKKVEPIKEINPAI
jgi:hypothetical protein